MMPVPQRVIWHHNDYPLDLCLSGDSTCIPWTTTAPRLRVPKGNSRSRWMNTVREGLAGLFWHDAGRSTALPTISRQVATSRTAPSRPTSLLARRQARYGRDEVRQGTLALPGPETEGEQGFLEHSPMARPGTIQHGVPSARASTGFFPGALFPNKKSFTPHQPILNEELAYTRAKCFTSPSTKYKGSHPLVYAYEPGGCRDYPDRSRCPFMKALVRLFERDRAPGTEEAIKEPGSHREKWTATRQGKRPCRKARKKAIQRAEITKPWPGKSIRKGAGRLSYRIL